MRAVIITPAPPGARTGNETTAERWRAILQAQGLEVEAAQEWDGRPADLMIALHAVKSARSIQAFHAAFPDRPLIVALTGTDVYGGLDPASPAWHSLQVATRMVVLQSRAQDELPEPVRHKVQVILQSVELEPAILAPAPSQAADQTFDVCVAAHLREVKDPLRAAQAARLLPATSRVRIVHVGGAMTPEMELRARREQEENPRFLWLGSLPRQQALATLARCRVMVISSLREGGANVIGEALTASVPPIASRIPGNVGLLGEDYPGYFEVGDSAGLADLLLRAEADPVFLASLHAHCARLRPLFDPAREADAWRALISDSLASMHETALTGAELSALLGRACVGAEAGSRRYPRMPVRQEGTILFWGREPGARRPILVAPLILRDVSPAGLSAELADQPLVEASLVSAVSVQLEGIQTSLSGRVAWLAELGGASGLGVGVHLALATDPRARRTYSAWIRQLLES